MGFTKFPLTCILELDGVESRTSRNFFEKVWNRLEELNIPYTLHWGKINFNLDAQRINKMYGNNAEIWKTCRKQLLDAATKQVFTNEFMERCGLDS